MPQDIVDVVVTTSLAGFPDPSFGNVVVIGFTSTGTANSPKEYTTKSQVTTDHGASTDLAGGIDAVRAAGAAVTYGVAPTITSVVDELQTGSASAGISSGTLQGTGIIDPTATISVTLDGTAKTIEYTEASPPTTPAAGIIRLNTKTKEWKSAESTNGVGGGVKFTYKHADISTMFNSLATVSYDILHVAAIKADLKWYGLLDDLKTRIATLNKRMPVALTNGVSLANGHKVTALITSPRIVAVWHKSNSDVAGTVAGLMAVTKPWETIMWKALQGVTQSSFYLDTEVGKRGQASTIEGGNASNIGPGVAVISVQGTLVLSKGLTTDGSGGSFGGWYDVVATRDYLVGRVKSALAALRLRSGKIPYTDAGIKRIESAIRGELEALVNPSVGALSTYTLNVPTAASISTTDKSNRVLKGIEIGATLAGDVESFEVGLNLTY